MKASELRLGNLVTVDDPRAHPQPEYKGVPLRVAGWSTGAIDLEPTNSSLKSFCLFEEYVDPIPLTEEWLLNKCGAIKAPDEFGGLLLPPESIRILKDENGFYHLTGSPFGQEIRLPFVHKLQNFIYEYTGTELTIKE